MTVSSRPFFGPNLYLTVPGAFTGFHMDGNGTVDSGHSCISGPNEVVMLRRLPMPQTDIILKIDSGTGLGSLPHNRSEVSCHTVDIAYLEEQCVFSPTLLLYFQMDTNIWPTKDLVEEWTKKQ